MLWSPIVKNSKVTALHNQLDDVHEVQKILKNKFGYKIELIINVEYKKCLDELRQYASQETKELKSSVLRLMQIEEKLKKHVNKFF